MEIFRTSIVFFLLPILRITQRKGCDTLVYVFLILGLFYFCMYAIFRTAGKYDRMMEEELEQENL